MSGAHWTDEHVTLAVAVLRRAGTLDTALAEIDATVRRCTRNQLRMAIWSRLGKSPTQIMAEPRGVPTPRAAAPVAPVVVAPAKAPAYVPPAAALDFDEDSETRKTDPVPPPMEAAPPAPSKPMRDDVKRLVDATKRGPLAFADLCDALDLSPTKARALVERARDQGVAVEVLHDHVGIAPTIDERIQNVGVQPVVGERQIIGVISDTHFGSKYCLRQQLVEFVHHAYARGAREILHPGDLVDGMYRHGLWEVSHMGLDAQTDDLLDNLPQLPGLNYRCITGNHDETFEDGSGVGFGQYLMQRGRERGRSDIHFYGRRSAFIRVGGAVVHLWHPRGSLSYAKSYKLQKIIEKYTSGEKPHLLLVGHFHQTCHVLERGVHGFLCPTFQGGGSAFGKSLGGAPTIGGMILSWEMTEGGTMRAFTHEHRSYYEMERAHNVDEYTGGREETPIVRSA